MKKYISFIALSLLTFAGFAQKSLSRSDVPKAVMNSYLSQNSSGATDSVWGKEEISIYKVYYNDNGQHYEANYFADGRWIKTFTELESAAIPVNVVNQVKSIYPNHKIAKAYIELNNDGKFYATDIVNGNDKMTIYFTMSGKFVK